MTCIVGINTGKKIIIAGDNKGSNGFTYGQYGSKVFKKGNFIFGVCGCYRIMKLLKYKFNEPKRFVNQSVEEYIYNDFTDYIIKLLKDNSAITTKEGLIEMKGTFIFGYEGRLMQMQTNFQIVENSRNYDACGSGVYHAMASLYSTEGLKIEPKERLKRAIICASEFVMSVDSKIDFVELDYDKKPKKEIKAKRKYKKRKK